MSLNIWIFYFNYYIMYILQWNSISFLPFLGISSGCVIVVRSAPLFSYFSRPSDIQLLWSCFEICKFEYPSRESGSVDFYKRYRRQIIEISKHFTNFTYDWNIIISHFNFTTYSFSESVRGGTTLKHSSSLFVLPSSVTLNKINWNGKVHQANK